MYRSGWKLNNTRRCEDLVLEVDLDLVVTLEDVETSIDSSLTQNKHLTIQKLLICVCLFVKPVIHKMLLLTFSELN